MVKVLLAEDILTARKIVLKITYKSAITEAQLRSAQKEPMIHATLDHPNVSDLLTWAETPTRVVLFLDYIENDAYFERKMIEYNEPFNLKVNGGISKLKNYCLQILEALCYIHAEGVVHLDIKPENILVTKTDCDANITLIDFNLS